MRIQERITEWDLKIRGARGSDVAAEISSLQPKDIPREKRAQVANLARRVGLYRYALTLLREDFLDARENPSENEMLIAEYAATLTEVGAARVAERLFQSIKSPSYEMTHFYRALLWMKIWRYDLVPDEIAAFKTFCRDEYRSQIADVNLVSALNILGRYREAEEKLDDLSKQNLSPMMKGVLSEQLGQLLFFTNRRKEARAHFQKSFETLKATSNPSAIYAEKWLLILDLFEREEPPTEYAEFRERAGQAGFWEVLRELDRFYALRFRKPEMIEKLYFGTVSDGYRELLKREFDWTPPESYVYPAPARASFNTTTGRLEIEGKDVKMPASYARLLLGLSQDLYRPVAVGSLFEAIYPGEFFHPKFASQRIYKIIARFREFTEKQNLNLKIDATDLGFKLVLRAGEFAFAYSDAEREETGMSFKTLVLPLVEKHFGLGEFTAGELAEVAKIPKRTVNRALGIEVENETIVSIGRGRGIRYRLKSAAK
jgi:hypothetical protein